MAQSGLAERFENWRSKPDMAIDESEGDGRRVADVTSGLPALKHEARLKEVKYLEVVWLGGTTANRNYSRRTLRAGERGRGRGSEWGKIGVRQRKEVKFKLFSPGAEFCQIARRVTRWLSLFWPVLLELFRFIP